MRLLQEAFCGDSDIVKEFGLHSLIAQKPRLLIKQSIAPNFRMTGKVRRA